MYRIYFVYIPTYLKKNVANFVLTVNVCTLLFFFLLLNFYTISYRSHKNILLILNIKLTNTYLPVFMIFFFFFWTNYIILPDFYNKTFLIQLLL